MFSLKGKTLDHKSVVMLMNVYDYFHRSSSNVSDTVLTERTADACGVSVSTVYRAKLRYKQAGTTGTPDTSAPNTILTARGKYPLVTEKAIFKDVPFIQLSEDFYPVYQVRHCEIFCVICNRAIPGDDQPAHIESPRHVAQQDSEVVLRSFTRYHDFWSNLPVSMHKRQLCFIRGDDRLTCTVCEISIDYGEAEVTEHVGSAEHLQNLKQKWDTAVNNNAIKEELYEPPIKAIKVEDDPEMSTLAPIEEVMLPSYSYQDYKAKDFIPLTMGYSSPERLDSNSTTVKLEPSCGDANGFD